MTIDTRIAKLVAAAACGTSVEQELLRGEVLVAAPHQTPHPGASAPLVVVLKTGRIAYFKRFCDQVPHLCAAYGHSREEVPLNEVIAWRLAQALGEPWVRMVPASALRKIEGAGGALTAEVCGTPDAKAALTYTPDQLASAAFWDALIGNQDRNLRNFRYDSAAECLSLIDHGFCFGRPGDPTNASIFVRARHQHHDADITAVERRALERLLGSADLCSLREYLPADRSTALEARAQAMVATGRLPAPKVF